MKVVLEVSPEAAGMLAGVLRAVHANLRRVELRPVFLELREEDRTAVQALRGYVWDAAAAFAAVAPPMLPPACGRCVEFRPVCAGVGSCAAVAGLFSEGGAPCSLFRPLAELD